MAKTQWAVSLAKINRVHLVRRKRQEIVEQMRAYWLGNRINRPVVLNDTWASEMDIGRHKDRGCPFRVHFQVR